MLGPEGVEPINPGLFKAALVSASLLMAPSIGMAADMKHGAGNTMKHGDMSQEQMSKGIKTSNVWSRATTPTARTGAVFLELTNIGDAPDLLLSAASDIAEKVELHTHLMDKGVMKMRAVEAFEVAPGAPTILQPGGNHIMLIGLHRGLSEGETFPVTLTFRDAGQIELEVTVGPAGARGHGGHKGHGGS